jgi:hypothetical protein
LENILPTNVIEASLAAEPNDNQARIDLPMINFRLRRGEPFPLLEDMMPVHVE